jgi:hypothetical protein
MNLEELQKQWTDRRVRVKPGARPDLLRFEKSIGRIVTITQSGRALVDFGDGAWYDLAGYVEVLEVVTDEAEAAKFDGTATSAQKLPGRQG